MKCSICQENCSSLDALHNHMNNKHYPNIELTNEARAMADLGATLAERGNRYGDFTTHALITQRLKEAMQQFAPTGQDRPWDKLSPIHREALEMIAHKIGRILNGDPNYADSWHDIAGYAKLVEDRVK